MKIKSRTITLSVFLDIIKDNPLFVIGELLSTISLSLPSYLCNVIFLKYIMSAMISHQPATRMLLMLTIWGFLLVFLDFFSSCYKNKLRPKMLEQLDKYFYLKQKKAYDAYDLTNYDDPTFFDNINYTSSNILTDAVALISNVCRSMSELVNIIMIMSLFSQIGFVVLVIVCITLLISCIVNLQISHLTSKKKYEINRENRKKAYFFNVFFNNESFADRKMTNITNLFQRKYDQCVMAQQLCHKRFGFKCFILKAVEAILCSNFLMLFLLFVYLLYEVTITKRLQSADFVASYYAATIISSAISEIIFIISNAKENLYTLDKYATIIRTIPTVHENTPAKLTSINSIELQDVSFAYPGSEANILEEINLKIYAGENIAIVGRNGSGKTTLVHLLMGLYLPTKGKIIINNAEEITKENYSVYRKQFAAFFQSTYPFEATIAENVALDTSFDANRVKYALSKSESNRLLKLSPNCPIGIRFDSTGVILSGGELQKLMLSHCYYCGKNWIVMDEPSSALDPKAEMEFNHEIQLLGDEKTICLVSHRLSTVKNAKYIYVVNNGRICEHGTHYELIQQDGLYKKMWYTQVEKYRKIPNIML